MRLHVIALCSLVIAWVACDKPSTPKNPEHPAERQLKERYLRSFQIPLDASKPIEGVWKARQAEVVDFVEKKFLGEKQIPKGTTLEDMRQQLKETNMFINFADGKLVVFFFAYNGIPGVNIGLYELARKRGERREYKGTIAGKDGKKLPISVIYEKIEDNVEQVTYKERLGSISFFRDIRPPELILEEYALKIRKHAIGQF